MKVLVIITTSFVSYGGLTTVAMNYYRHINKEEIHMDFASTNILPDNLKEELDKYGSCYFQLPKRKKLLSYYSALKKICKKYDIVHIHANSATATMELLAAKNAGVNKRIIHIHNTTCAHKVIHKALKPIFDKTYTDAVACSQAAGEWIFSSEKFTVLNNAIDIDKYSFNEENRDAIRKKYEINDALLIGHVGKLIEQKNHTFALDVFKEFLKFNSNSKFMLVGGGALESDLKEKAKKLGIEDKVIFCGMQNSAVPYLSAFDVMMFPSLWEGLPLSLVEAQANGLKCVASDSITFEVNMGGVVFLSLEESVTKWCTELVKADTRERKKISELCKLNMAKYGYDIQVNARMLERIYRG